VRAANLDVEADLESTTVDHLVRRTQFEDDLVPRHEVAEMT
jgi:hypothetical protein